VHDTAVDGTKSFDANAAAKSAHAAPFKRPENGVCRPGSHFREFYFDETGDTDATSPENETAGGWGSIMKLTQRQPSDDTGELTLFTAPCSSTATTRPTRSSSPRPVGSSTVDLASVPVKPQDARQRPSSAVTRPVCAARSSAA
jgi:secreted PhoX family phosphatase